MNHSAKLYHNPQCSKSRAALEYLQSTNRAFTIIEYLKTPPSTTEVLELCAKLNTRPLALIRAKDKRFHELGYTTGGERSHEAWAEILSKNPQLIERPILIIKGKAAIGRPLENIIALVESC
jgi:arsenate reductase (glutaredoxin)